jgi:ribonuclease HI
MNNITIYTDGAYSPLRDQGGIGLVILYNDKKLLEYSNTYYHTSNNQMEVGAVIIALRLIKKPCESIEIHTDSQYVIGCGTLGWKRRKNGKLWQELDNQIKRVSQLCPNIKFIHVKGHQNDDSESTKWNNIVDKLAVQASQTV